MQKNKHLPKPEGFVMQEIIARTDFHLLHKTVELMEIATVFAENPDRRH